MKKNRTHIFVNFMIIGISMFFYSCETLKEARKTEIKKPGFQCDILKNLASEARSQPKHESIADEVVKIDKKVLGIPHPKSTVSEILIPQKHTVVKPQKKEKPFYEKLLKNGVGKKLNVELNFDAANILDVVDVLSGSLHFNYFFDPRVKGAVTMKINTKMTEKELWQLFERILWMVNAYCTYENNTVRILPFQMMPQERRLLVDHEPHANIDVALIKIKHTASQNIMTQIRPFMTPGAKALNIKERNALLLVETPDNLSKLERIIKLLDVSDRPGWPKIALYCMNVPASQIVDELTNILPVLGYPVTVDKVTATPGSIHLTSADRLRIIIASAANYEALEELKRWVNILDRDDTGEQERVFVYKVINNTADDLMKAVSAIFSASTSSSGTGGGKGGRRTRVTTWKSFSNTRRSRSSYTRRSRSSYKTPNIFDTPIKIFADGVHQRLVIRTTPRTYAMMKALLMRLDTVPAQILLQVVIAEINLSSTNEFGVEFGAKVRHGGKSDPYRSLYGTNWKDLAAGSSIASGDYGFNYYVFNKNDSDKYAYLRALANTSNTKVLSSPQIVTVSHKKATVKVGDKVPIVTKENTDTQSATAISRDIQYQDTGIILEITPYVTKGGLITLDFDQTVSDAVKTTTSNIDSPTIQERHLVTTLSLRNGATLVVGGLIWKQRSNQKNSLPVLAHIPFLSNLLGYNEHDYKRVELLVLITATIIDRKTDLQKKIARYKNAIKMIEKMDN